MAQAVTLSSHARWQLARRGLNEEIVFHVARDPEQVIAVRPGREIRQRRVALPPGGKTFLVRVVVHAADEGLIVITAYRTSRIEKYWRKP